MLKILIADDDISQCRGFASILRKLRPEYEVFEARSGREALDIFNSQALDILFTDIRMPNMSGLDVSKIIRDKNPNIKIVILSGYKKFEYAQQAITLDAFDYILKPISEEKIEETLKKLENIISKESARSGNYNSDDRLSSMLPIYIHHKLNKWLYGFSSKDELKEVSSILHHMNSGVVILMEISKFNLLKDRFNNEEIHNIRYDIYSLILDMLSSPRQHPVSFYLENSKSTLVTVLNFTMLSDFEHSDIAERLQKCVLMVKERFDLTISIGIGNLCDNILDNINKCFENAMTALVYRFHLGVGKIISYQEISKYAKPAIKDMEKRDELIYALRKLDQEGVLRILSNMINEMASQKFPHPKSIVENILNFVISIFNTLENIIDEHTIAVLIKDFKESIYLCEEMCEVKSKLNDLFIQVIGHLSSDKGIRNEQILKESLDYIERNYMKDISLESVADAFHFNASYFSTLFKTYRGVNFSEYLSKIRLSRAKELLMHTDKKVYDISSKVGYNDVKYFNKVFKKEFGITPEEFRRKTLAKKNSVIDA